jgi:hypothetical protein
MKWLLLSIFLALTPACAVLQPAELPVKAVTAQDQALQTVAEIQLIIGAIIDVLDEQRAGQIITDAEYFSYEPVLTDYFNKTKELHRAILLGAPDAAMQANALKAALLQLHKQIAMKARQ